MLCFGEHPPKYVRLGARCLYINFLAWYNNQIGILKLFFLLIKKNFRSLSGCGGSPRSLRANCNPNLHLWSANYTLPKTTIAYNPGKKKGTQDFTDNKKKGKMEKLKSVMQSQFS